MSVVYVVLSILLSVALVGSGMAKLAKAPQIIDNLTKLGVPMSWLPPLAACEFAGAAGLLIGLKVHGLAVAAAIGVIGYFVGAVATHVRANDKELAPPAVLGLLAVAVLVLRLATL